MKNNYVQSCRTNEIDYVKMKALIDPLMLADNYLGKRSNIEDI